jgi:hypothetical protein
MAREAVYQSIGATVVVLSPAAGATLYTGFTGLAGQVGVYVKYVAGASIEIGGLSLIAGNGYLLSTNAAAIPVYLPIHDTFTAIVTGTTTGTFHLTRCFSEGITGSQG